MKNKLTVKEWINAVLISAFKKIEQLQILTIRQLKALAQKINRELGQVIVKARFGKVMSNMTKAELVDAIWSVRVCQMQTRSYDITLVKASLRIYEYNMVNGAPGSQHWISYFGFNSDKEGTAQQNAERFRTAILKKGLCHLAAIRWKYVLDEDTGELKPNKDFRLKKTDFEYEVKVWGIKNSIFDSLVKKDKQREWDEIRKPIVPVWERPMEERIDFMQAWWNRAPHWEKPKVKEMIAQCGLDLEDNKVVIRF